MPSTASRPTDLRLSGGCFGMLAVFFAGRRCDHCRCRFRRGVKPRRLPSGTWELRCWDCFAED